MPIRQAKENGPELTMLAHQYSQEIEPAGPLRFERRANDRWQANGSATAFRLSGTHFGTTHELSLMDCSDDGLGAISDTVIEPGTIVSVAFQAPGIMAKRGTVLRCLPCGNGYRIAIQYQARMAA
jgi:hypothetical protein